MTDRGTAGEDDPAGTGTPVGLAVAAVLAVVVVAAALVAPPAPSGSRDGGPTATREPRPAATATGAETRPLPRVTAVSGGRTVRVTYATAGGERSFAVEGVDPASAVRPRGWAVLARSELPDALVPGAGREGAGVVTVGPYAVVGNLTRATAALPDGPLTVVAPAGLVDPARKAAFLERFLAPYDLRPEDAGGPATLVAVPESLPARGKTYGTAGYVASPYFWDGDAGSVWLHEAIHTRQSFALAREMRWFREASAEYLSMRVMAEQYGEVTNADVRARLDALPRYPNATLANASTWRGDSVDYRRGTRLLYAVDAAIRAGSDGRRSLVDVFRRLDGREDPIDVAAFVRAAERAAGTDLPWLRPAITSGGPIEALLPAVDHGVFRRPAG